MVLESLWYCNTFISRSLCRENINFVSDLIQNSVSRPIEYRAVRMLIVLVQDTIAMAVWGFLAFDIRIGIWILYL